MFNDVAEVFNVLESTSFDVFGVVEIFVAEVDFIAGDFPVAETSSFTMLFVEFEICSMCGVADGSRPYLFADLLIACEYGDASWS